MPSKSKQQQKFMGMVHSLQKGDMKPSDASVELKRAAKSLGKKDAKDYASTSHKGLPRKVKQEILGRLKEYASKIFRHSEEMLQFLKSESDDFVKIIKIGTVPWLSKDQIYDFLKEKYGDWIIYDLKLNKNTYILWLLPLLLFVLGGAIMIRKLKITN